MMMECPRCGFAQPEDQYCASCGVNMAQILAKPKPFFVRLLQNPNFHLSLIGALIVAVVGWIFYTQSAMVSREVGRMLDLPVSSRNAGDPNDPAAPDPAPGLSAAEAETATEAADEPETKIESGTEAGAVQPGTSTPEEILAAAVGAPPPAAGKAAATADPQKIEMNYWEIPRETLAGLFGSGQRIGESAGGRAYYWAQGAKVAETLQAAGQPLGAGKSAGLNANSQLTLETAPTAPEMFQYSLIVQLTKFENKEAAVRWSGQLILPQAEAPGDGPAMRQVLESNMSGNGTLAPQGVIMLVVEPPNRSPREEYVAKAGDGPWSVFGSPEYRSGLTDWIIVLQLK